MYIKENENNLSNLRDAQKKRPPSVYLGIEPKIMCP